ncbi:MAG: carboxypeptidase regulatory-like domain-containing protein [Calditrichota bacterium]
MDDQQKLTDYLDLNRGLYIEGNNWCADHRQTDLFSRFHINFDSIGVDNEINRVTSAVNCRIGENRYGYLTGAYSANIPDRISAGEFAETILTCNLNFTRGVYHDGGSYRTYGQSISFVGLVNNQGFNRAQFLRQTIIQLAGYQGTLRGQVVSNRTGEPVEGATISVNDCGLSAVTDAHGNFAIARIPVGNFSLRVEAHGYTVINAAEFSFEGQREMSVEIRMTHPEIALDPYTFAREINQDAERTYRISVSNPGEDLLQFSTRIRAMRVAGKLWDEVESFDAGSAVNDDRLQAAMFFQGHYWIAGGNGGADSINKLYKVGADGDIVAEFDQDSESDFGYRDLTNDGQFIYAVDDNYIAQINPATGIETGVRIQSPVNPTLSITYDPATGWFWISGDPMTNIMALDRRGNRMRVVSNRNHLNITALFWDAADEDRQPLKMVTVDREMNVWIMKNDCLSLSFTPVVQIAMDREESPGGGELSTELYPYTRTLVLQRQGPEDWISNFEAGSNFNWISLAPQIAEVAPGSEMALNMTLNARGMDIGQTCEAHILFDHNTPAGDIWLDVTMTVVDPLSAPEATQPVQFGITGVYPNPFNSTATVEFGLDQETEVQVDLYDLSGRMVETLLSGRLSAGTHRAAISAEGLASGLYLVRLSTEGRQSLQKVMLTR